VSRVEAGGGIGEAYGRFYEKGIAVKF